MSNNELLLAISDILDKKFDEKLEPINNRLDRLEMRLDSLETRFDSLETRVGGLETSFMQLQADMNSGFTRINFILENEIRPQINILAENYMPAAIRYAESLKEQEILKEDIGLLQKVVTEHSEQLQRIS